GGELDEDEIAPAYAGRRIADHEGFDVGDLHMAAPSMVSPSSGPSGHLLPAGEKRKAATSLISSPRRGEGGRAKRRPGEGAVALHQADIPQSSRIISAPFQPVRMAAALVLPLILSGKIEASTMRKDS